VAGPVWLTLASPSTCSSACIILAGLLLRLAQGRFWIIHQLDRTIILPNISVWYGIFALVYAVLGIINIHSGIAISLGREYPQYYVGVQIVWPLCLWTAMYSEIWATFASYYIRKFGAFYRESWGRSAIGWGLPVLIPLAVYLPPAILSAKAAHGFNTAIRQYEAVVMTLRGFQAVWVESDGLDIVNLLSILEPVEKMALALISYSAAARPAFIYLSIVLLATFFVYLFGAWLEVTHLKAQAAKLRAQMQRRPKFAPMSPIMGEKGVLEKQLMEEWSSGIVRQASLLEWACTNRIWSASLISLMLLEGAATSLWYGLTPLSIKNNSAQFMSILLVSSYMNGVLSTLVSLLILFRSLDGSSTTAQRLQKAAPWLPLPPAVSAEGATTMQTQMTQMFAEHPRDQPYEQRSASPVFPSPPMSPMTESSMMVRLEMGEKAGDGLGMGSYFAAHSPYAPHSESSSHTSHSPQPPQSPHAL